ncbi:hypothetical protein [Sphingobacterium sp. UGAL515B_05]|uniref:hypothetical protein n=1 Tax=Sphingobacterium sp. UGAL515B_05 TaxID=2986767 RepID=UPI002952EB87|nr:hypothetical protein [Sphingobacterium sp. UGAL515B_05]WON93775.1 hypothetical protein OK025_21315 [Sphingobacterium sp. UGAL515B_05]
MRLNLTLAKLLLAVTLLLVVSISTLCLGIYRRLIENGKNNSKNMGVFPKMPLLDGYNFAQPKNFRSQLQDFDYHGSNDYVKKSLK